MISYDTSPGTRYSPQAYLCSPAEKLARLLAYRAGEILLSQSHKNHKRVRREVLQNTLGIGERQAGKLRKRYEREQQALDPDFTADVQEIRCFWLFPGDLPQSICVLLQILTKLLKHFTAVAIVQVMPHSFYRSRNDMVVVELAEFGHRS